MSFKSRTSVKLASAFAFLTIWYLLIFEIVKMPSILEDFFRTVLGDVLFLILYGLLPILTIILIVSSSKALSGWIRYLFLGIAELIALGFIVLLIFNFLFGLGQSVLWYKWVFGGLMFLLYSSFVIYIPLKLMFRSRRW